MLETPFTLPSFKGEQISLFSLDLKAQFTSKNLKYPLKDLRLKTLFSGSLNEATDHFFSLSSTPKSVVLVYQKLASLYKFAKFYNNSPYCLKRFFLV
ncbi:hypothetical protein HMPREF1420_01387 [Helicobacter pylori GAM264Ai]|nr:hypothetical protein HMPREF1420_01387 [Helicobacter pylori GAM264Ai]WRE93996.1 hypothetical protein KVE37_06000 [Helicobacter pylori]